MMNILQRLNDGPLLYQRFHIIRNLGWALFLSGWSFGLIGCGGAQVARDKMTQADTQLNTTRKLKCPHHSIALAEQAYARSQEFLDRQRYDEAARWADVARKHAEEAERDLKEKPCKPPEAKEVKGEQGSEQSQTNAIDPNYAEDMNVAPFEAEENADLHTIYFKFDSFTLDASAHDLLEKNLSWMREHPQTRIVLGGHCDSRGTYEYNLGLGDRRAQSVARYLQQAEIHPSRIEIVSYGSDRPASHLDTDEGHQQNRRVEFAIVKSTPNH